MNIKTIIVLAVVIVIGFVGIRAAINSFRGKGGCSCGTDGGSCSDDKKSACCKK